MSYPDPATFPALKFEELCLIAQDYSDRDIEGWISNLASHERYEQCSVLKNVLEQRKLERIRQLVNAVHNSKISRP